MIDAEGAWKSGWKDLPLDDTGASFAANIADEIDSHVSAKLAFASPWTGPVQYTWQKALFQAAIASAQPVPSQAAGAITIASAWKSAVLASLPIVSAGAMVSAGGPEVTFSAPPLVVIDPSSVEAAYASLVADITNAPLAKDAGDSQIPVAIRKAFLGLKFIVSGINSIPPPAGPLPIPPTPVGVM